MTSKTNTFEGQSSGTPWVVGTSGGGSGDAFNSITTAGTVTTEYSNTQKMHNSNSLHISCLTATNSYVIWSGFNGASMASRFYMYTVSRSAAQNFFQFYQGATQATVLGLSSSGQIQVKNSLGTTLQTFTAMSLNTWYRIEVEATKGVSNVTGTISCRYYLGDSASPVEAGYSSSVVDAGVANFTEMRIGKISLSAGLDVYYDSITTTDVGTPLGPYVPPGPSVSYDPDFADLVAMGYTGSLSDMRRQNYLALLSLSSSTKSNNDLELDYWRSVGKTGSLMDARHQA